MGGSNGEPLKLPWNENPRLTGTILHELLTMCSSQLTMVAFQLTNHAVAASMCSVGPRGNDEYSTCAISLVFENKARVIRSSPCKKSKK